MSIKQAEGGVYHIDITIPSGKRVRHSTGTSDKKAAQEYHDTLKAKLWRVIKLDETPSPKFQSQLLASPLDKFKKRVVSLIHNEELEKLAVGVG